LIDYLIENLSFFIILFDTIKKIYQFLFCFLSYTMPKNQPKMKLQEKEIEEIKKKAVYKI
jgi:hypothetical protein